jgi:hypothetical protein
MTLSFDTRMQFLIHDKEMTSSLKTMRRRWGRALVQKIQVWIRPNKISRKVEHWPDVK